MLRNEKGDALYLPDVTLDALAARPKTRKATQRLSDAPYEVVVKESDWLDNSIYPANTFTGNQASYFNAAQTINSGGTFTTTTGGAMGGGV